MELPILKNGKSTKASLNLKRLKAGWDEEHLARLWDRNSI